MVDLSHGQGFQIPEWVRDSSALDLGTLPLGWYPTGFLSTLPSFPQNSSVVGKGSFFIPPAYQNLINPKEYAFLQDLLRFLRTEQGEGSASFSLENLNLPQIDGEKYTFSIRSGDRRLGFLEGPLVLEYKTSGQNISPGRTLKMKISTQVLAPHFTRTVPDRGSFTPQDLSWDWVPLKLLYGTLLQPGDIPRKAAVKGPHFPGSLLISGAFTPLWDVIKDRSVRIIFVSGPFRVELTGTALEDGALEQEIEVRTSENPRRFRGLVTGVGEVQVQMP